jgi:hypothetical protein
MEVPGVQPGEAEGEGMSLTEATLRDALRDALRARRDLIEELAARAEKAERELDGWKRYLANLRTLYPLAAECR